MNKEELDTIRARLARWERTSGLLFPVLHYPVDVTALLAEVDRLRADRDTLLATLAEITALNGGDTETNHSLADRALLDYINDPEIEAAYEAIERWYA